MQSYPALKKKQTVFGKIFQCQFRFCNKMLFYNFPVPFLENDKCISFFIELTLSFKEQGHKLLLKQPVLHHCSEFQSPVLFTRVYKYH